MPLAIFDLDNTLVDRTAAFRSSARWFAIQRGLDPAHVVPWMEAADEGGQRPRPELFASARAEFRLDDPVRELAAAWWPAYLDFYRCADDTIEALKALRTQDWKIGIATNGDIGQEEKLRRAGLDRLVDAWCVSELVGHAKPAPEIFRLVAERCGATLEGAWMVGDSGPTDIAGAVAAGISSAWLHRGRVWGETGYRPTIVVASVGHAVGQMLSAP
ncbi:MAG: HAD family hydrolase [Chloroflexota bacterium]|nr:HAD family hydrolase [Chloroflexota bacterium]